MDGGEPINYTEQTTGTYVLTLVSIGTALLLVYTTILADLLNLSYPAPNHSVCPELAFNTFCDNLSAMVKAHTPRTTIKRSNVPIWLSRDL